MVRTAQRKDIPAMERICLETAAEKFLKTEKEKEKTLYMYNRYYTRAELSSCFVLTDGEDRAVGYILCAPDYRTYRKGIFAHELKSIAGLSPARALTAAGEIFVMRLFSGQYPAHLHIDILPDFQGKGNGTLLMQTLLTHLREKGVRGVMLGVSASNTRAVHFYKKQGFRQLAAAGGGITFGLKL